MTDYQTSSLSQDYKYSDFEETGDEPNWFATRLTVYKTRLTSYLNDVFTKKKKTLFYNADFVTRNTHSNTDSNTQTSFNCDPVTTTTITIRATSENMAPILQIYNIRFAQKLITTLRRLLTNAKSKEKPEDR